ncbi:MAG: putative Zn-dependent hydrolase of beta-lactamase fold protein [Chitinophagaceae bacterium]|nr:putative Zn-dependent hydrolase of beta-lactamase fold protein [Chitinophagaceae bacterium]
MAILKTLGKNPSGKLLEKIQQSPNFRNGSFQNLSETEMMASKEPMLKLMWKFFTKPKNTTPASPLPFIRTDLKNLPADHPAIVWFGHSSYLIRINGKHILVDPVFSGHASPFSFTTKSFPGTNFYSVDDMPEIDLLIISHDHYDHLAYETLLGLKPKVKQVCTSPGVSAHLIYWGFNENIITELDWWQSKIFDGIEITAAPARHFSGRTFKRNQTLWSSFILRTSTHKIYAGADSGYDSHFKTIGENYGPFDIAILECGQYNEAWPYIHMMPEENVQACIDLGAKWLLPVHWGKFAISLHPWDEPIKRVKKCADERGAKITTPLIGEPVLLDKVYPQQEWWLKI